MDGGVELFVRRFGDPDLPKLVVIHGGPTWDHSYLLPAVATLSDIAHVVMFDLRGCGRSARTPPLGELTDEQLQPEHLADDVAGLIGDGQADVLGFSYGGRIAMRVVQRHPEKVRRLVLASTTAYTDYQDELESSPEFRERASLCDEADFNDSRAYAYAHAPLQIRRLDRLGEWHRVLERVRFSSDYNRKYAERTLRPGGPDNAAGILRDHSAPTLILHGEHDLAFPVGVARRLHAELPASTLAVIPDAGHMAHFDNEKRWTAAIRDFLGAPAA